MSFRRGVYLCFAALLLALVNCPFALATVDEDRDRAAKNLADEIRRAGLHKVYVADFLDPAGKREFGGLYFASVFSTRIASHAKAFEVVNRINVQKALAQRGLSSEDLDTPESAANFSHTLDIDGLLLGTIVVVEKQVKITFRLLDVVSNKEIGTTGFSESLQPDITGYWPVGASAGANIIYFNGLDGVSQPQCISCPNPPYTEQARRTHFQGVVITGALITAEGKVEEIRVIQDPKNGLAALCVAVISKWRFKPAKDASGMPVPVHVPIETSFKLF